MKFLLLLPFLLIGSCLFAQNKKSTTAALNLTGLVTDSITQKPVPGATVEIVSKDNAQYKGNAISDFSGKFTVKNVPHLNNLQVTITAIGYGTETLHTSLAQTDFDLN